MKEEVTAIFFSCRRIELLARTVRAFTESNTYPVKEMIIVNDSGDRIIHELLRESYPDYTLVLHPENVGLIRSIDLGYQHIKTNYFFHCEDDWMCNGRKGFIERSLMIMTLYPQIEEVWLADYNRHPLENELKCADKVTFRMVAAHQFEGRWHGFTTACGLKRMEDYRKVGPYGAIPWDGTIWHREAAIGQKYFDLGYRSACLTEEYAVNIGIGKSEYKTGFEI